ncbi:facilitated trehalose transporter Tret1-2 homolog [Diorhabda sublineata]|uniref:facilitated trehalose transporter Tret1-2 homolog n=1 Tax=Diorhabda sublineata TaxID=1163346 RepID=UPI0024E0449C|nr:facilitated trehalose transporter Tret1-2 homolog [Diorhabda sublineata]
MLSASLYINEISEDSYRGTLGCLLGLQIPLGLLYGFVCGALFNVRVFTLLCAAPAVIHLILSPFIPESPVYLITNHKRIEAVAALKKLGRTLDKSVTDMEDEIVKATTSPNQKCFFEIFKNSNTRKAFFLASQMFVIEQFSGISIILAYVVTIIDNSQSTLTGNTVSIIIGLVKVATYLISLYLIDRIGRRKLILTSSFLCIFPIFFMGVYSYLSHIKSHAFDNLGWLLVTFVIFYVMAYSIGLGTVPMTFAGEVFPDDFRATGVALVLGIDQILACAISFSYPNLAELWGSHWCFWVCSFVTTIGFINMFFTVPETKGKSFAEIQKMLSK